MPFSAAIPWLAGIVASWAASRYGNSNGGTPNQYPTELTPEQRQAWNEIWRVYKEGGSDIQRGIQGAAIQFINNTPTTAPGFKFVSHLLRDQPFAGGIEMPRLNIDFQPRSPSTPPPAGGATPRTTRDLPLNAQRFAQQEGKRIHAEQNPGYGGSGMDNANEFRLNTPWGTSLLQDAGARDPWTGAGDTQAHRRTQTEPPPSNSGGGQPLGTMERVRLAWDDFKRKHPNWGKMLPGVVIGAIAGATGLGSAVIIPFLRSEITGSIFGSPTQPLPQPTGTFGSVPQPGVKPVGGGT